MKKYDVFMNTRKIKKQERDKKYFMYVLFENNGANYFFLNLSVSPAGSSS